MCEISVLEKKQKESWRLRASKTENVLEGLLGVARPASYRLDFLMITEHSSGEKDKERGKEEKTQPGFVD